MSHEFPDRWDRWSRSDSSSPTGVTVQVCEMPARRCAVPGCHNYLPLVRPRLQRYCTERCLLDMRNRRQKVRRSRKQFNRDVFRLMND